MSWFNRKPVAPTEPAVAGAATPDTATASAVATESTLLTGLAPLRETGDVVDVTGELRQLVWALVAGYANGEARITEAFLEAMPANPKLELAHEDGAIVVKARR